MADSNPVVYDPAKLAAQPDGTPEPSPMVPSFCSNLPTGGPVRPDDPSTFIGGTKAGVDLDNIWTNGTPLKVHFLNDGDAWGQTVREAVERLAPVWSQYANLTFDFSPQREAHIVVQLSPIQGYAYWSVYGKQALNEIRNGRWSMSLAFDPQYAGTDFIASEFKRVIPHEFGHAIGFYHEHMRPDRAIVWDVARVRARYSVPPNRWNDQTIQNNILDFYKPAGGLSRLRQTAFDVHSIMMYAYPPDPDGAPLARYQDTNQPFVTQNNYELSPLDKILANMIYPATGVQDPDEDVLAVGDQPRSGTISKAGQVARYRFQPETAGVYGITVSGDPMLVALLSTERDPGGRMIAIDTTTTPTLKFNATRPGADYFIEIRHAQTMSGTGTFDVGVATSTA